jgi:hypothetical protein
MAYKLVSVLKTRHVEPWAEYIFTNKVLDKPQPGGSADIVRKASEFGWFDGDMPDVDDMIPSDVVALGTMVMQAYSASMGFDLKNSQRRQPVTPPEK